MELPLVSEEAVDGLIIQNVTLVERAQRARSNAALCWEMHPPGVLLLV